MAVAKGILNTRGFRRCWCPSPSFLLKQSCRSQISSRCQEASPPGPCPWIQDQLQAPLLQQHCSPHFGESPLPSLSLRLPLISLEAEEGYATRSRSGIVITTDPHRWERGLAPARATEEQEHFHLCDCVLPFDALDVYCFIMY